MNEQFDRSAKPAHRAVSDEMTGSSHRTRATESTRSARGSRTGYIVHARGHCGSAANMHRLLPVMSYPLLAGMLTQTGAAFPGSKMFRTAC